MMWSSEGHVEILNKGTMSLSVSPGTRVRKNLLFITALHYLAVARPFLDGLLKSDM